MAVLLLEKGASIKTVVGRKQTFFHKACASADADFIEVLIDTTMRLHGQEQVDELLHAEDMDNNTPLLLAVKRKSSEITKKLLDLGGEVDHHNSKMVTSMHMACSTGTLDIVKLLHGVSRKD
jgi:ankyrin repeat protein